MFGNDDVDGEVAVAHDVFMAELGRALSSYATRVAAPATALGRPRRFRRKIRIVAYAVSLGHRRGGATAVWGGRASGALASLHGAGIGGGVGFDADAIRDELRRDDPGRPDGGVFRAPARRGRRSRARGGVRLRASRGTSPALAPDGSVESRRVRWVDSGELRRQLSRAASETTSGVGGVAPTRTKIPSRYPCSSSSPISPPSATLPATRTSRSSSTDTIRRNLWTTWCSWRSLRPARGTVRCSATAGNFAVTSETPPKPPSPRWWNTWGACSPRPSGTTSRSGAKNTVVMVRRVASVQRHRGGRVVVDVAPRRGAQRIRARRDRRRRRARSIEAWRCSRRR